jgi:hypothetical protein
VYYKIIGILKRLLAGYNGIGGLKEESRSGSWNGI